MLPTLKKVEELIEEGEIIMEPPERRSLA